VGQRGRIAFPRQAECQNRAPTYLTVYFGLGILLVFSRLLIFAFFGVFSGDLGL